MRKPKEHQIQNPGDLVQLDTLDVRPLPGVVCKHFTVHDVISKWNVRDIFTRATAVTATQFLEEIIERMPFEVKAIQIDRGSDFQSIFEEQCQQHGT